MKKQKMKEIVKSMEVTENKMKLYDEIKLCMCVRRFQVRKISSRPVPHATVTQSHRFPANLAASMIKVHYQVE